MKQVMVFSLFLLFFLGMVSVSQAQANTTWIVSETGDFTNIEAALSQASDGDRIEVHAGLYATHLLIDKQIELVGVNNPVIDGQSEGTSIIISADNVLLSGFTIRNTGTNNSHEDSAIVIQADNVLIENNRLENVLYGIYFADADNGIARNNHIIGYDLDLAQRGDGIRVWFSNHVSLENNYVSYSRDTLIWYADDIRITGNTFRDSRYGLHFMYSDNAWVENNHFTNNSVGTYLMYSTGLSIIGNNLSYNRGPSGYGIALKDMDNARVENNWIVANRVGLYLDNSPSRFDSFNDFRGNVFAYNDIGVAQLPSVARNQFAENNFIENTQQVSVRGRGTLQANIWTVEGVGNYWSDYIGYDVDEDGQGDIAYRSEKLFDSLADEHESLRLFIYSPAVQALDFAAAAFPTLRPELRLEDSAPLSRYHLPDDDILSTDTSQYSLFFPALLLSLIGVLPFFSSRGTGFKNKQEVSL